MNGRSMSGRWSDTLIPPSGPPTQSEIDYGCAIERVRSVRRARRRRRLLALVLIAAILAASIPVMVGIATSVRL